MDPPTRAMSDAEYQRDLEQRILRAELVEQCYYGQGAATSLAAALRRPHFPPDPRIPKPNATGAPPPPIRIVGDDPIVQYLIEWRVNVLAPIQAILQSAAVVANILWDDSRSDTSSEQSPATDRAERCDLIFEGLTMPDLPNLKSKKARNALAHIEDHVLRWMKAQLKTDPRAALGPLVVFEAQEGAAPMSTHFRGLNTLSWDFWVEGRMCNLRAIVGELHTISRVVPSNSRYEGRPV
jgi:hypothetical protein